MNMRNIDKSTLGYHLVYGILLVVLLLINPVHAQVPLHFNAPRNFVTCPVPSQVLPMDLDDDNDLDVAVECGDAVNGFQLQFFENQGNGDFILHSSIATPTGPGPAGARWVAADLNSDGRLDLVKAYGFGVTNGKVHILLRNGLFSFSQKNQELGTIPGALCVGNLDGANGPDLAIGDNLTPASVHVYLNGGTADFIYHGTYATEQLDRDTNGDGTPDTQYDFRALDCKLRDLEGDGDDDLIYTNSMKRIIIVGGVVKTYSVTNIVTLPNQGNGTLGAFQIILDADGKNLAVEDLEGDGDQDILTVGIALTGTDLQNVVLLRNNGNGTFQAPARFASGGGKNTVGGVTLGDVDRDGDLDVGIMLYGPVSNNNNDHITDHWALLRNNGQGVLSQPEIYPAGADILDLAFADLGGTLGLEALTTASDDNRFTVYYNRANRYLIPTLIAIDDPRAVTMGSTPLAIASGDLNSDNYRDLAVTNQHSRLVADGPDTAVLLNGITGGVTLTPTVIDLSQELPSRMLIEPMAGSATDDIAILFLGTDPLLGFTPPGVGILLGVAGALLPAPMRFTALDTDPHDLAALDVNNDGIADIAVLRYAKSGELTAGISILTMAANGALSPFAELTLGSNDVLSGDTRLPAAITTADMNGDGRKELVAVTQGMLVSNTIISVILNNGNGTFNLVEEYTLTNRVGCSDVIAVDVTGDGRRDVILARVPGMTDTEDGSLEVLPNLGDGVLGAATSYNVGKAPVQVIAAEIDGAAGIDLVVASDASNEITLLLNNGAGNFTQQERYLSGGGTDALTVADLDQDGSLDVAVANDNDTTDKHFATVSLLNGYTALQLYSLTVSKAGTGTGVVASNPEGINCGADCNEDYTNGMAVLLTATPDTDSTFVSWSGCTSTPTPTTCQVRMDQAQTVIATFNRIPYMLLNVSKAGTGSGTVTTSNSADIICGSDCQQNYPPGTIITLTARPDTVSTFAGWSGCTSTPIPTTCQVRMDQAQTVIATFNRVYLLTITKRGTGSGTVTSSPLGITCGSDCQQDYPIGTTVNLTATPNNGVAFAGWGGACSGLNPTCQVTLDRARSVTATFNRVYLLTITKRGTGSGTVTSSPLGITCGSDCNQSYASGTNVTLTARVGSNSLFAGWSGACSGTATRCTVTMDRAKTVTATFNPATYPLHVTKRGNGSGTVTSSPAGINCGSDCNQSYASGKVVRLTAKASSNSVFAGWSGACSGTASSCTVTMTQARTVTAAFTQKGYYLLTVSKTGSGSGTVTSSPSGINCGSDCDHSYRRGTTVKLTAKARFDSVFAGWKGACSGRSSTCQVTLSRTQAATAIFNRRSAAAADELLELLNPQQPF